MARQKSVNEEKKKISWKESEREREERASENNIKRLIKCCYSDTRL